MIVRILSGNINQPNVGQIFTTTLNRRQMTNVLGRRNGRAYCKKYHPKHRSANYVERRWESRNRSSLSINR